MTLLGPRPVALGLPCPFPCLAALYWPGPGSRGLGFGGGGGQTGGGAQMAIVIAGRERGDHRLLVGLAAQCTQQSVAVWPAGIY